MLLARLASALPSATAGCFAGSLAPMALRLSLASWPVSSCLARAMSEYDGSTWLHSGPLQVVVIGVV